MGIKRKDCLAGARNSLSSFLQRIVTFCPVTLSYKYKGGTNMKRMIKRREAACFDDLYGNAS